MGQQVPQPPAQWAATSGFRTVTVSTVVSPLPERFAKACAYCRSPYGYDRAPYRCACCGAPVGRVRRSIQERTNHDHEERAVWQSDL